MNALRRSPLMLLTLGLLAVAWHVLAGTGLMPVASSAQGARGGEAFVADLCTSHGLRAAAAPAPADTDTTGADCCQLCAAGAPVLPAGTHAVSPAPTFAGFVLDVTTASPPPTAWRAPPPRGPPAHV